jgi:hypothetical protein
MLLMGLRDVKESKELLDELEELYEPNPNMVNFCCVKRVFLLMWDDVVCAW